MFAVTVGLYLIAWCRDASMLALMLRAGLTHGLSMLEAGMAFESESDLPALIPRENSNEADSGPAQFKYH